MRTVLSKQIKKEFAVIIGFVLLSSFIAVPLFAQKPEAKGCEYKTFNLKVNPSVSANEVLTQLSDMCDFSIVFADTPAIAISNQPLHGSNIKNRSLFEVFDLLVSSNNLNYQYKDNILKLSALETKSFKVDYITSIRQGTASMSASITSSPKEAGGDAEADKADKSDNEIIVKEEFDFWKTLNSEIQAVVNTGRETYIAQSPVVNSRAGLVTITATKDQLKRAEDYFAALKQRLLKQVLIDVTILSIELNEDNRMGINWSQLELGFFGGAIGNIFGINSGSSSWGTSLGSDGKITHDSPGTGTGSSSIGSADKIVGFDLTTTFSMAGVFDFLKEKGKTNVVSSPKILTLNNQQALITVGDTINYQTTETSQSASSELSTEEITNYSIFIGILLNILPTISDDNTIMLRINPSLSDFKYAEDNAKQDKARTIAPDTMEKKLSTVVNVKNGETIILGGLITESTAFTNNGVPILRDIPILGYAFKYSGEVKRTFELAFIITPKIVGENTAAISLESLSDLGYNSLGK